jgi:2-oxoglutarate/2-oxoacid ferredoxin oxidoreductase subunit alpha
VKADPKGVLTGSHYMDGDHACCEGALAAGCRFVAGYPITPSTEVVERFAARIPIVGGAFIQMEDELASSIAIQGAVWAGKKAMTVTSGPGYSLMMEHIGLAVMTECPCVFVNVQRGGPSTGLPTLPGQGDMMQARWGSHGDYEIIAICPGSPQECFDYMIDAFNLSEKYRLPVMFMMDECVGHMMERVVIPEADKIDVYPRKYTTKKPGEYLPFEPVSDMVPDMVKAGDGYRIHVTGLTHDYRGYPAMNAETHEKLLVRLMDKVNKQADQIIRYEEVDVDDADVVVVSYGISHRVAIEAVREVRKKGIKVGMLRLITVWPFPEKKILELAEKRKALVMVELNLGQVYYELDRCSRGKTPVFLAGHAGGGVHSTDKIIEKIVEAHKCLL